MWPGLPVPTRMGSSCARHGRRTIPRERVVLAHPALERAGFRKQQRARRRKRRRPRRVARRPRVHRANRVGIPLQHGSVHLACHTSDKRLGTGLRRAYALRRCGNVVGCRSEQLSPSRRERRGRVVESGVHARDGRCTVALGRGKVCRERYAERVRLAIRNDAISS